MAGIPWLKSGPERRSGYQENSDRPPRVASTVNFAAWKKRVGMTLPGLSRSPDAAGAKAHPVSHYLTLLVLSILLPVLVLAAGLVWRIGVLDRDRVNQQALQVAKSVMHDIDRDMDNSIESLLALASSPTLLNGKFEEFYRQATETMSIRNLHILVKDLDGQQVMNTRAPWGSALPRVEPSAIDRQVISTRQPGISDLVFGAVAQNWVLGLSVPVVQGDQVRYMLTLSLDPEYFQRILKQSVPAPEWVIALSDRNNKFIAHSVDQAGYVGREMHPQVTAASVKPEGANRTPSLAGFEVMRGYSWSEKSGWLVAAAIPSQVIDAPLLNLWRWFSVLTLALGSIVLALSYYIGKQITDPLAYAKEAANKLGRIEEFVPKLSLLKEANQLSEALAAASTELRERARQLAENEERYRTVFEQSAVGFVQVALDGRLMGANDRLCKMLGYTREECLAKNVEELTHPDDWPVEERLIGAVLTGEKPHYVLEKRLMCKDGAPIWVQTTSSVVRDGDGKALYRTSVVEDVAARREARAAAARLAAIVQSSQKAMISCGLGGDIETWNPGAEKLFGYSADDMAGKSIELLASPAHTSELASNLPAVATGKTVKSEFALRHKDGSHLDVAWTAAPITTGDRITAISVIVEDIGERKRRETQVLLLNRELAHRVRNTVAVIQSIANQTMRSTPDPNTFRFAFQGRLQALSDANDLLRQTNWTGAELRDFIDRQLSPLMGGNQLQLHEEGPHVLIPAEVTVPLGLALHELGTNAIKYGAWSVPGGEVRLCWELQNAHDLESRRLIMTWSEHNGPAVQPSEHRGFGTTLIERGIPESVVERNFPVAGLVCRIDMALPASRPAFDA